MVPVAVSAGLAVGVFCGLLFGLGTGKRNAAAEPPKVSNGAKRVDDNFTPEPLNPNVKIPDKNAPPKAGSNAGSAVAVNTGSAGSNAGSDTGSAGSAAAGSNAGSAEPAVKPTKLIVEIKPDTIAQFARISVDGKEFTGTTTEISPDPGTTKKKIKVLVKAPGYKDVLQEVEVEGESITLKLELTKSSRTSGTDGTSGTAGTGGNPGAGNPGTGGGNTGGGNTGGGNTGKGPGKASGGKGKGKGSGLIDI